MKYIIIFIFLILSLSSCKTKRIFTKELNLSKIEYKILKKQEGATDSILKYYPEIGRERVLYRLRKYQDSIYDWKKFYSSLQLETVFGKDFEFSDSVPADSPKINEIDSLRIFKKKTDSLIDGMMQNIKVNSVGTKKN